MGVDSAGSMRLKGESGSGTPVWVQVDDGRILVTTEDDVVGDWQVSEIGIRDLREGFAIRAEGEELVLIVEDEVGFADEIGLAAATPRLARKVAAAHNPEERELVETPPAGAKSRTNVLAIAFALGGVMVLLGGTFLRNPPVTVAGGTTGSEFWGAFVFGGILMVALAFALTLRGGWARVLALVLLAGIVITFGVMITSGEFSGSEVPAYGFIAGGIVVGVAVLFSGSLKSPD